MRRPGVMVGMLALALAMPACGAIVVDPSDPAGEGSNGETGSDSTTSGGATTAGGPSAVAMRFSQWTPPYSSGSPFQFAITSAPYPSPDALVLFFASKPQACAQPFIDLDSADADMTDCSATAMWQAIIVLPPERAQPGVIDLNDPSIFVYRSVWMASCGGGSADTPGVPGSLTISSIDATSIVTKLELEVDPGSGFTVQNGDYTATICP